jgi:hypothetical protein
MEYLLISSARRISGPFLRFGLAIILAWIGALKFVDPSPVVNVIAMAPVCESRRMTTQAVTA